MKDILQALDPDVHKDSKRLKVAVLEAWKLITDTEIRDILYNKESGMHARCTAVIAARGMYTKF